jgi:hypothetical protein
VKNLDGLTMFVSSTAENGVVSRETHLHFVQRGGRVAGRYAGGRVVRGWLVGQWAGEALHFRYAQCEDGPTIHAGHSECRVRELPDGRLQLIEQFAWDTRPGSGVNVFDELPNRI